MKNEFFYDPFLAGDRSEHANLFYDILQSNRHINCYLLNTGYVGEGNFFRDITLADTMGIIEAVLRRSISEWVVSDRTGMLVPRTIPGVDSILVRPEKLFAWNDFDQRQKALDAQRAEYINQYAGLNPGIKSAFQEPAGAVPSASSNGCPQDYAAPQPAAVG